MSQSTGSAVGRLMPQRSSCIMTGQTPQVIAVMTTIHTIEDLIRLLDEKPEWVEALRDRLLTRELIELPEKFANFAAATTERLDLMDQRMDGIDRRLDGIDQRLDRIEVSLASICGGHARDGAIRKANSIARRAGLLRVHNLSQDDLQDLTDSADTSQVAANELESFLETDLVIEAKDPQDETFYIAVEISYTVNGRDTTRAIRNAGLLRSLTGREAPAFVAGLHEDDPVQDSMYAGDVVWYELEPADLEVD